MGKGGGPALEELAREGDANSVKFSVSFLQEHSSVNNLHHELLLSSLVVFFHNVIEIPR